MKNLNLFLAFVAFSTVAMASDVVTQVVTTEAPVAEVKTEVITPVVEVTAPVAPVAEVTAPVVTTEATEVKTEVTAPVATTEVAKTEATVTEAPKVEVTVAKVEAGFLGKVYGWTVQPTIDCAGKVNGWVQIADDKIVEVCAPYTKCLQNAYTEKVAFVVQRPAAMILTAGALYATYYACTHYNKTADKKSKN